MDYVSIKKEKFIVEHVIKIVTVFMENEKNNVYSAKDRQHVPMVKTKPYVASAKVLAVAFMRNLKYHVRSAVEVDYALFRCVKLTVTQNTNLIVTDVIYS